MLLYVAPLLRLCKTLRGFRRFNLALAAAVKIYSEALPMLFIMLYVMMVFASLIYYIEPRENIQTYGQAIWFTCATMSTVGYGDVIPQTTLGQMAASVLVCSSVFIMAMPLGIIGQSISEIWKKRDALILRRWAKERLDEWGYLA